MPPREPLSPPAPSNRFPIQVAGALVPIIFPDRGAAALAPALAAIAADCPVMPSFISSALDDASYVKMTGRNYALISNWTGFSDRMTPPRMFTLEIGSDIVGLSTATCEIAQQKLASMPWFQEASDRKRQSLKVLCDVSIVVLSAGLAFGVSMIPFLRPGSSQATFVKLATVATAVSIAARRLVSWTGFKHVNIAKSGYAWASLVTHAVDQIVDTIRFRQRIQKFNDEMKVLNDKIQQFKQLSTKSSG